MAIAKMIVAYRLYLVVILFLVFAVSCHKHEYIDISSRLRLRELQDVFQSSTAKLFRIEARKLEKGWCSCSGVSCGCCAHMDIPEIHLNDTVCINITYLPDQIGFQLTVSINGNIIFKKEISANDVVFTVSTSAKNPPAICVGVPQFKQYASLCIDFYNVSISRTTVSGCIKIQARLDKIVIKEIELGCFKMSLQILFSKVVNKKTDAKLGMQLIAVAKNRQLVKSNEYLVFN